MQLGLLDRTPRGRVVTKKGYEHIGMDAIKYFDHSDRFAYSWNMGSHLNL